jgi:Polyketide cyclase / dehydrase and lipid transport
MVLYYYLLKAIMIINKDVKIYRVGINMNGIIPAVIFVIMGIAFVALPQALATSINVTRDISAPADQVWSIISNVDDETQYWSTFKEIKNINEKGNIIEREVIISAGPQNNTSHQIVTIYPEQMKIQTNLTQGLVTGSRNLHLEPVSDNKSRINAIWNIDLSGIPIIGRGFAENGIKQTTEEALSRIAQAVE